MIVGIEQHGAPHLMLIPFLQHLDVVLVVVVGVKVGDVEVTIGQHDQYRIIVVELAQEPSMLFVIDAVDIGIEPNLSATKRTMSVTLQANAVNSLLSQDIAFGSSALDKYLREVFFQEDVLLFLLRIGIQCHLNGFGLAIRIGREIHHSRPRLALCQVVVPVSRNAGHVETLDEVSAFFAILVHYIINSALVILLEHLHVNHVLAHKYLVGHPDNLELSVLIEDDDVVDVGAVAYKLVLFQSGSHKSFLSVDVQLLISLHYLGGLDGFKTPDFGQSGMVFSVLVTDEFEPMDGHVRHVSQVVVNALDVGFRASDEVVGFVFVELQDAVHLDFQQSQDVVAGHFTDKVGLEWLQSVVYMSHHGV